MTRHLFKLVWRRKRGSGLLILEIFISFLVVFALSLVSAQVPLKEMFGYVTALRSLSQGRGNYTMKFSHYDRA